MRRYNRARKTGGTTYGSYGFLVFREIFGGESTRIIHTGRWISTYDSSTKYQFRATAHRTGPFDFRLAGLAVQLSWLYLLLYSGGWNPSLSFTRAGGSTDVLYLLSTAALCTVLPMGIWRIKPFMQFARTRPMRLIAPALAMLGTLSYCLINTESLGLAIAGGIFTGVGSAFLWARWAGVFGNVRPREVIGVCPLVVAVAVLVCFSVGYLNPLLQTAAVVLLPGTSGAWLVFAEGTGEAEGGSRTTTVDAASAGSLTTVVPAGTTTASHAGPATAAHASVTPANSPAAPTATTGHSATLANSAAATTAAAANPRRSPRRHYAPLVVFAAFLGFTTGFLPAFSFSGALMDYDLIFYSGVAVFCLVFVAAAIFADDRRNFSLLFAAPAVVMLCVLLPFSHFASTNPIVAIMEPLGSIAFELFLLIGSVLFARMTDHSPARAYLITRFSMSVFDVLGLACGGLVMGQTTSSVAMQIAAVVMFLITEVFIAVLAFAYFSNRKGTLGNSLQQQAPSNAATLSEPSSPGGGNRRLFPPGPLLRARKHARSNSRGRNRALFLPRTHRQTRKRPRFLPNGRIRGLFRPQPNARPLPGAALPAAGTEAWPFRSRA